MGTRALFLLAVTAAASPCFGQAKPEEAMANMKAKQAAREAERSKIVQISAGELQDLRDQIRALRAQNTELARQLVTQLAPPATPKKRYTQIEVGMTRAEFNSFMASHTDLKIVGMAASTGVSKSAVETVVRRETVDQAAVARNGGKADQTDKKDVNDQKEIVERKVNEGKKETITVAHYGTRQIVTGTARNVLGQDGPVYGRESFQDGKMVVEFTDDVVTSVAAAADGAALPRTRGRG